MGEGKDHKGDIDQITWKRLSEVYSSSDYSLFGEKGISPSDVLQGAIGNCWFMAAAAAVAEQPGRLEKVFVNPQGTLNSNGIYAVNLYTLGMPHTVIVDDYLPLTEAGHDSFMTFYAHVSKDKGLWGPILEKAFAKYHGNYEHLSGGDPNYAVRTLTGAPMKYYFHSDEQADALWT